MPRRLLSRVVLAAAVVVLVSGASAFQRPRAEDPGSYSDGVAVDIDGRVHLLPADSGAVLLPGSRVLAPQSSDADDPSAAAAAQELAQEQQDWLASGWLPQEYRDMVAGALLDMKVLSRDGGTTAAFNTNWRYVWPRDSSFVAAAFAVSGHVDDAVQTLLFLQRVQGADGSFEARYLPDGSGTPDDRVPQTDGTGWALWAMDVLVREAGPERREELLAALDPLLKRSTAFLLAQVDNSRSLPAPSSDYWEHRERVVTLGTAAPVLAGLQAASRLHSHAGDEPTAEQTAAAAARTSAAIATFFGPHHYSRYPGPSHPDAASAFVLPPFTTGPLPGAVEAWSHSVAPMMRPAGGLAPGGGWRELNLSWTPQTALYALAAASNGDEEQARHWLDWIEDHRTPIGAIPEKVNSLGDPSGPAPLTWTGALVVLTVAELER